MVIIGSNALALLTVTIIITILLFPVHYFLVSKFVRVSHAEELMGQEVYKRVELMGSTEAAVTTQDHIQGLINEYYPDNVSDYLLSKYKLLMKVKTGNKQAQERLD